MKMLPTLVAAAFGVMCLAAGAAMATQMQPRVAVPDRPGGDRRSAEGCFQIREGIHGPYKMSFCLDRRGSYRVVGGGLTCNGGLSWQQRRGTIEISLRRSQCGRQTAWTADRISCRDAEGDRPRPRVAVPNRPQQINTLRCTYRPVERGYRNLQVTAFRIR
jgi:hypothetical protein